MMTLTTDIFLSKPIGAPTQTVGAQQSTTTPGGEPQAPETNAANSVIERTSTIATLALVVCGVVAVMV